MTEVLKRSQPLGEPHIPKVEGPFGPEDICMTITRACPQGGPGLSVLRYRHLYAAISAPVADDIASFARTAPSGGALRDLLWSLYASETLIALGDKARPVACVNVLRRIIGATFFGQYRTTSLEDFF